ncbi:hypothetical protein ACFQ88_06215 [Paenibacillus sp. NPDC056579]|uniref:hypothetical protein n=1 Tax=unclassified Paenibacillus TaxID=185978 RepID=UPI001EF8A7F8|nr:hypothetical protein [Paenibacillus sp. H1-7]
MESIDYTENTKGESLSCNRIDDPGYQEEVKEYVEALSRWILFEEPPPVHTDESAATIV